MNSFSDIDKLLAFAENYEDEVILRGMVKSNDNEMDILFTPIGCDIWVSVAKNAIIEGTFLGNRPCAKEGEAPHSHPFVELRVAASKAGNGDYLTIIAAMQRGPAQPSFSSKGGQPELRYFGPVHLLKPVEKSDFHPLKDNCGDRKCYYVGDQCPYGCACVDEDGMGFCSTCCVA